MERNEMSFCQCHQIRTLFHELNQSLLVINTYTHGCKQLINRNSFNNEQLLKALEKINQHAELVGTKIHEFLALSIAPPRDY